MNDEPQLRNSQKPHPRAVGAPLPRGGSRRPLYSAEPEAPETPAPSRALASPAIPAEAEDHSSNLHRAANALRAAVPFVQRLLPLLDGNVVAAVANVLTPHPKPAPPVDLAPIQQGMSDLHVQQRALGNQVAEQQNALKRVEDHLEQVREATDRNTLEQQELMEDLKSVGNKMSIVAFVTLALLLVSVLLNLFLYLHIERILP